MNFLKIETIRLRYKWLCCILRRVCNTLYYLLSDKNNILIVNAPLFQLFNSIKHFNIGDDLNFYLLRELSGKKVFSYREFYHIRGAQSNILAIGSIIDWLGNENAIVWGSGILIPPSDQQKANYIVEKVVAVRGKRTRDCLINDGIDCPEVYGDPALLLPLIYHPKVQKVKGRIGIIPHYADKNDKNFIRLLNDCGDNGFVIRVQNYKSWRDVVNQILSCEFIISSSLHGLILSDAYGVPNQWITFATLPGGVFKFEDYYSAVGKAEDCVRITDTTTVSELLEKKQHYIKINFDSKPLLLACPFTITNRLVLEQIK